MFYSYRNDDWHLVKKLKKLFQKNIIWNFNRNFTAVHFFAILPISFSLWAPNEKMDSRITFEK